MIAKTPRQVSKTKDITGGLPRVAELFEARRPKDPAMISEIDGIVEFATSKKGQRRIIVKSASGMKREYIIPHGKHLNVYKGDRVKTDLAKIRKQIEAMGYTTRSVADTVAQINSLFATAKTLLLLLGMVALAVAALGMFNTLTVSLLERTREVGLMKAMGMKSSEVKELFLTESMTMGFFGGVLGIVAGFVLGKLLGLILSFFAIFKGVGYIDVSYLPLSFVLVILLLSLIVGLATGIYPAKRATKISALNALRYE